ncbi:TMEM175 family protein [Pedobacter sp. ASV12]|uniref:TMEM175 family protein n=1 Tax=Pedobacter sp. ASV12 TaxID=2795120 RepID=UPI0018EB1FC6|nr:TMEM175 family protein [Pedobacter sp. ASV12]
MKKGRTEAFSDGVIAIIITIMVLELKVPHEKSELKDLVPLLPVFLSYVLSFIYVGIYWNNHHHMFTAVNRVNGAVLWANLHLLFWLSMIPFATAWMGENHFAAAPVAVYGGVLLMNSIAYFILMSVLVKHHGNESLLAKAVGSDLKGKLSTACYILAIPLAYVSTWISGGLFVLVALIWLIPDRRIENVVREVEDEV